MGTPAEKAPASPRYVFVFLVNRIPEEQILSFYSRLFLRCSGKQTGNHKSGLAYGMS